MADLQFPGIARGFQHADLSLGVAEDDSLSDGECIIQVAQCVELPLLSLHCHKELLDALQRQLITETSENPFSIAQIGQKQCTEEKLVFCVGIQHVGHHTDSEFYMTALHLSQKCVKKKLFKKGGGGHVSLSPTIVQSGSVSGFKMPSKNKSSKNTALISSLPNRKLYQI